LQIIFSTDINKHVNIFRVPWINQMSKSFKGTNKFTWIYLLLLSNDISALNYNNT